MVLYGHATVADRAWIAAAQVAVGNGKPTPPEVRVRMSVGFVGLSVTPAELWSGVLAGAAGQMPFAASAIVTSVVSFVFLPIARRRAKVRIAHLVRCAFYLGCGTLPLVVTYLLLLEALAPRRYWSMSRLLSGQLSDAIVVVPVTAILAVWWFAAASRYLRMQRPMAIALSVSLIAILVASTVELT